MFDRVNPYQIFKDQFCPFRHGEGRRFHFGYLFFFLVVPIGVGCPVAYITGPLSDPTTIGLFLAVFSLVAAVLTAMISIIHAVLGGTRFEKEYDPGQFQIVRAEQNRLDVLRELHTNIAFAVILLIFSLVPLIVLLFSINDYWAMGITMVVFSVAVVVAITVLSIMVGVYDIIENEAIRLNDELTRASVKPRQLITDDEPKDDSEKQHFEGYADTEFAND